MKEHKTEIIYVPCSCGNVVEDSSVIREAITTLVCANCNKVLNDSKINNPKYNITEGK